MSDLAFLEAARGWLGVAWRHQGRSRAGIDCIGLVVMAARVCGLDAPLAATYGRTQSYFEMKPVLCGFARRIAETRPGALLLYKDGAQLHLAIATETPGHCIQALAKPGGVIEGPLNFTPVQSWGLSWPS